MKILWNRLVLSVLLCICIITTPEICFARKPHQHHQQYVEKIEHTAKFISKRWKTVSTKEAKKIVLTSIKLSYKDFPTSTVILAIIAKESSFDPLVIGKSKEVGLMQILYKPSTFDIENNINDGTALLREYYIILGNEKEAIHAYNVGIGNYFKGKRNDKYYRDYLRAKRLFDSKI